MGENDAAALADGDGIGGGCQDAAAHQLQAAGDARPGRGCRDGRQGAGGAAEHQVRARGDGRVAVTGSGMQLKWCSLKSTVARYRPGRGAVGKGENRSGLVIPLPPAGELVRDM